MWGQGRGGIKKPLSLRLKRTTPNLPGSSRLTGVGYGCLIIRQRTSNEGLGNGISRSRVGRETANLNRSVDLRFRTPFPSLAVERQSANLSTMGNGTT